MCVHYTHTHTKKERERETEKERGLFISIRIRVDQNRLVEYMRRSRLTIVEIAEVEAISHPRPSLAAELET